MPPPRALRYHPSLDGLRGIAILLVIAFHTNASWTQGGFLGVDVFFVLSGFLITGRLLDEFDASGTLRLRLFFARRALRLFPAFIVVVVVVTLWALAFFPAAPRDATARGAIASLLYCANWLNVRGGVDALGAFGHTWSLSIEEQFYALWPLVSLALFRTTRRSSLLLGAAMAMSAYRGILAISGADVWRLYNGFDTRCDGLLLGAALAAAHHADEVPQALRRWAPAAAIAGLAIICVLLPAATYLRRSTYGAAIPAVNVSSAALILACVEPAGNAVSRLLSLNLLRWVGRLSYSLYLWHLPVLFASRYAPLAGLPLAIGIALSIVLAAASYYIVERPALRLKHRFEPLLTARPLRNLTA